MTIPSPSLDDLALLREVIAHLDHRLPGQAPIRDFVHHNTLHGFECLLFPEALAAAREATGIDGYQSAETFRSYYAEGRISREDLVAILEADSGLAADQLVGALADGPLTRLEVLLAALWHPLKPVTACQLSWQIEAQSALSRCQLDVAEAARCRLLARAGPCDEASAVGSLWNACLEGLGLQYFLLHPEELMDLSPEQAERLLTGLIEPDQSGAEGEPSQALQLLHREGNLRWQELFDRVGRDLTLNGLLKSLTRADLLEDARPILLRHLASHLDQGLAAWHHPLRSKGLYAAWRESAVRDLPPMLGDVPEWRHHLEALPEDPWETLVTGLTWLGLPRERWGPYLERLALELPGWSGMMLWRSHRPGYAGLTGVSVAMADWLAMRLVMERLLAQRLCQRLWRIDTTLTDLRDYFRHHRAEFLVRYVLFNARLPEYLANQAQRLLDRGLWGGTHDDHPAWERLAQIIWTWRQSPAAGLGSGHSVYRDSWRLFRLAQHLGLCAGDIRRLGRAGAEQIFACLDQLDEERSGFIWLQAYERHYREQFFNALVANRGRGRWARRETRPAAQVVFCMDDREEGFRRHLEEANPAIETLGAAGFFGVPIHWRGLNDLGVSALCPVVVRPSHEIREVAAEGEGETLRRHRRRRSWRGQVANWLRQETRRGVFTPPLLASLAALPAGAWLAGRLFFPLPVAGLAARLKRRFEPAVRTRVAVEAPEDGSPATPEHNRLGLTDTEQADWVRNFLRVIGLLEGFSPLVVLMGHGSSSQNNPHLAAYDCGACSGRHGGPNARVFAAIANRPVVRARLRERGLSIPDDCWFVGAEHNTCDESLQWYDLDQMPAAFRPALVALQADLDQAVLGSAHERCRRLASAPDPALPTPSILRRAIRHIRGRAVDFSQPRPELGHATNAAALIGRRSLAQGVFFDRRLFLISYDPFTDPTGEVLEGLLLAVGPVGAGINLEYYFSTVDNDRYGCGTKVIHNVTGLMGVMEGTMSDLRTGLPRQMIEIHEAMRLQVIVEHRVEVLSQIYERQPPLQELIGNGWLLLSAMNPDSGEIRVFEPGRGFLAPWRGQSIPLPRVARSPDWYSGHREPLPPALIEAGVAHA
ncbi:MAG: DUF2309 domain-containing protein [Pseudomonadota bacterium]